MSTVVLVPVKDFAAAKARLAPALGPEARADLARTLAEGVLAACGPLPTTVVCDDAGVRAWAEALGHDVAWTPGLGLNGAVTAAAESAAKEGRTQVVVVHADLPYLTSEDLTPFAEARSVALAPDRREDGTNVASVPAGCGFRWQYGAGSFGRHAAEAGRLGLPLTVLRSERLAWDVDVPDDLVPAR
jgi:2-phospho-L-lactate/phosphoenolpyruvate guanylyltransferase